MKTPSIKTVRRTLIALAALLTLVSLFYTVENWRGKRAWEQCKRELQAKGAVLDWAAYIPAAVPDDQNIFKAPKMQEWFVARGGNELTKDRWFPSRPYTTSRDDHYTNATAQITMVSLAALISSAEADIVLSYAGPGADAAQGKELERLLGNVLGPGVEAPLSHGLIAKPISQIKPVRIAVRAEKALSVKEIERFMGTLLPARISPVIQRWTIEPAGTNRFQFSSIPGCYAAADFLERSSRWEEDFAVIREAARRPLARMEGSYEQPFEIPIPNFVALRNVAQMTGARAQSYLLLGQPEQALRELTLMHEIRHFLEAKPAGKPMTLVAVMINVAVRGLYVKIVADGLSLGAWQEPQLVAIEEQLQSINLPPFLAQSLAEERVAICHLFENITQDQLKNTFGEESMSKVVFNLTPRGWIYQNMITDAVIIEKALAGFDLPNGVVFPSQIEKHFENTQAMLNGFSPYTALVRRTAPNFAKAIRTTASNQTLVNQGRIACALERYRLAHRQYPETLEALAPQYLGKLPHDLVGGKPLHYSRNDNEHFVLYSVGWNETDDGGTVVRGKTGETDMSQGDWVWPSQTN